MQLTYNQFRKVADKSSEKLYDKFSEIFAESENAALMALYDDKIIVLDEETNQPYICSYDYSNGILSVSGFELIDLTENDDTVLGEKVGDLFDIENDPIVPTEELVEGFRLKFYDNARREITEAKDNKLRKIYDNPSIMAKHKLRELRDRNYAQIHELMTKPFVRKLSAKLQLEAENAVSQSLNKVDWSNKKGYKVDTNVYNYISPDIKSLEDKEIKAKMKALAGKLYKLWKTDAFRQKFSNFTFDLQQAEALEDAIEAAEMFFENNKELFLLEPSRYQEVMMRTALMTNSKNANTLVEIMNKLLIHDDIKAIKEDYYESLGATPEQIAEVMFEQDDEEKAAELSPDAVAEPSEPDKKSKEKKDKAADEVDDENIKEIVATLKTIKKQLDSDSDEADFLSNIISDLENAKAKGIEDTRLKEIIDFLAGATKGEEEEEEEEE